MKLSSLVLPVAAVVLAAVPSIEAKETERVSVGVGQGYFGSLAPSLSGNGAAVAFESVAPNLVAGDTNGVPDVFVRQWKQGRTLRVSVASDGTQGNGPSAEAALSGNGRFVAFGSDANNLTSGDTNGAVDVFVHDTKSGQTTRVSVSSAGAQANAASYAPGISGSGRYVVFLSQATDLVAGDTNGAEDVFVHDTKTGATTRVSVGAGGAQADGPSFDASISEDGRWIAFASEATNLVAGDSNGSADVFLHDRKKGTTTLVSVGTGGAPANSLSLHTSVSADGRWVAFSSDASNLVAGDTNGFPEVFVRDMKAGVTTRASVDSVGAQGNGLSELPKISHDGRWVAFASEANDLVWGDGNGLRDVFVRDRKAGVTYRVSVSSDDVEGTSPSDQPAISGNGKVAAFSSWATNLVDGDANGDLDVMVRDLKKQTTTRASVSDAGGQADDDSGYAVISGNGRFVTFESFAFNLVPDDANDRRDIMVHDRKSGATTRVSVASDGTEADQNCSLPVISDDGRYVAFMTTAGNLVPGDTNGVDDIFVHDRKTGETERVSVGPGGVEANWHCFEPSISASGRFVAFRSAASNLVPDDTNAKWDIFVHDRKKGVTTRVSVASDGTQSDGDALEFPSISDNGRYVAFTSLATNLVSGDTNAVADCFVHDTKTGKTTRVSVTSAGAQASGLSDYPVLSGNGRFVAFRSDADDLVTGDTNFTVDIFLHDTKTGVTRRVSVGPAGEQSNGASIAPAIDKKGRYVAFQSVASNLVAGDSNALPDVFLHDAKQGVTVRVSVASDGQQGAAPAVRPRVDDKGRLVSFESVAAEFVAGDGNGKADVFVHDRK